MRAWTRETYCGPEGLSLSEIKLPKLEPKEVSIKTMASSINPADWRLLRANPWFIRFSLGLFKPKKPYLGADIAGIVTEVGSQVKGLKKGDRIVSDILMKGHGAFSEQTHVSAEYLVKIPKEVEFAQAAGVPIAGLTALQALRDWAGLKPQQHVLINGGSGGVGTFAIQIAKHLDADVTAVCSCRNLDLVAQLGADHCIDYQNSDFRKAGKTYDIIFDAVGNVSAKDCSQLLKPNGKSLMIGFKSMGFMLKYMLHGLLISWKSQKKFISQSAKMNTEDLSLLMEWMASGHIRTYIDRTYPFKEVPKALAESEKGRVRGKLIIDMKA